MPQRIPHGDSPVELRQAFQRMEGIASVLFDGESGELLVGVAVDSNPVWQSVATAVDHGSIGGLTDDDHAHYLLADGTRALTGNMAVDAAVTIDGRDLSVDGTKLDTVETNADVTDATNVAAAGAAMAGGAFHDGFSDFVANEHIDHSGVSVTAGSGIAGGGDITTTRTLDLDINSLAAATIVAGDFVPFWDLTATATNKKTTFANFEAALTHDNLVAGTIASHDTTATGANLTSMTDDSMVDALHRHSELSASDGTPDKALQISATGDIGVNVTPLRKIHVAEGATNGQAGSVSTVFLIESFQSCHFTMVSPDVNESAITFADVSNVVKGAIVCDTNQHLYFRAGGNTDRMWILADGKVGLGISPVRQVHIAQGGGSGAGGHASTSFLADSNTNCIFAITSPDANYSALFFGSPSTAIKGGFLSDASDNLFVRAGGNTNVSVWLSSGYFGVGPSVTPDTQFEVTTASDLGKQAVTIDQNDADQAFIDFQGTSAANAANSVSSWTTGNSIQGFTRQEINGTTYWMPYYDAPTS